jgi:MFS family permease
MTFFASGIFFRGFSVFFGPVRDSLHLSNAQTALIFSLARAEGGLEGPIAGWFIDRFGNRVLMVGGIILSALGYFLFAWLVDDLWSFALIYLGMVSLGSSITFQHAMFAGLNNWFRRRRSLAISVLAAISSLGGLVLVPLISLVVLNVSWQWAAFAAGMAYLVGILPMTLVFRNRPEDVGLLPDGDVTPPMATSSARGGAAGRSTELRDYTVNEALHTRAYWLLMLGAGMRQVATLGIQVNIVPILVSKGMGAQTAANFLGLMFAVNIITRLVVGYFADRWSKSHILVATLAVESLSFLCLFYGSWGGAGILLLLLFILLAGLGDGAGIIIWAALGDYYGRDRFATLRGIITFSHSWAVIAVPVFTGWVFDQRGSYNWAIGPSAVLAALASLSFMFIKKPPQLTKISAMAAT